MDSGSPSPRKRIGLFLGPAVFLLLLLLPVPEGLELPAWRTAAVAAFMAIWWITEAIPIPMTALLPLALLPVLQASSLQDTASPYANPLLFLFLGGFLIARAMQRWGLHRRIALGLVRALGTRPLRLIAGFMLATAFLSMWVSNTATTVMMVPIGASVIHLTRGEGRSGASNFGTCLMLGIAYAASIGGIATLVGTPPNALFAGFFAETYGVEIGFAAWMAVGLPVVAVLLPLCWFLLGRVIYPVRISEVEGGEELLRREAENLGPMSHGERVVAIVFTGTALAWIFRPQLANFVPGLSDPGIAVAAALLLFVIPADWKRGDFVLDWRNAAQIPWELLVLLGGGLSLAGAINRTGLAPWLGTGLSGADQVPVLVALLLIVLLMIFLTELTSNTASTAAFLPVLAALAVGAGENPILFTAPAVVAASCAFMMPVATPPNALVFASGEVDVPRMARAGIVLNLLFATLIPVMTWWLVAQAFGVVPGVVPDWAGAKP